MIKKQQFETSQMIRFLMGLLINLYGYMSNEFLNMFFKTFFILFEKK